MATEIMKRLDDDQIKQHLKDFVDQHTEVHDLANRLKHRQYIENDNYLLYADKGQFHIITCKDPEDIAKTLLFFVNVYLYHNVHCDKEKDNGAEQPYIHFRAV